MYQISEKFKHMYQISEKFKSVQGEGVYAGVPMAFIRFVGCSVGKKVCQHCDTDFEKQHNWRGGGVFDAHDLIAWVGDYEHVCLTGGEPLDQDLLPLLRASHSGRTFHLETSGTKSYELLNLLSAVHRSRVWVCVSPKPGFSEDALDMADEIKVIVPGLGDVNGAQVNARIWQLKGEGYQCASGEFEAFAKDYRWPTIDDAKRWATTLKKPVFLQPRNSRFDVDLNNLRIVQDLVMQHPNLFRLSTQLHKILKVQ